MARIQVGQEPAQRPPEEGSPEEGSPAEGSPMGEQDLQTQGPGVGPGEMLDEEAIERFGRDLDEADLAARALAEESEDPEDEEEDNPAVPAASY